MIKNRAILNIESLELFERLVNHDTKAYERDMLVMPGTLEDKHKNCESIPPLRRQFNLVYLLLEGEHDVKLGADHLNLNPCDLVIVPENTLYASDHIKNCKGYCIHFKAEFLSPYLLRPLSEEFPFFHFDAPHIINLHENESLSIQSCFKDIIAEHLRTSVEKDSLIRSLLLLLLIRIREIYRTRVNQLIVKSEGKDQYALRFKLLVEKNFIEKRTVKQYADMLHVSAKYLSEIVSSTFGRAPLQIIHDILLLEAKVQLSSTDKSISEIAYYLNFEDQAHFSHFIKKRTGMSPQKFRKKL